MRRTSKKQQALLPFQMNKMIKIGFYQTDPESDFIKRHKEYFNRYSELVLQSTPGNRFRHFVLPFLINTQTQWQTESDGITIRPDYSSGMKYNYQKRPNCSINNSSILLGRATTDSTNSCLITGFFFKNKTCLFIVKYVRRVTSACCVLNHQNLFS